MFRANDTNMVYHAQQRYSVGVRHTGRQVFDGVPFLFYSKEHYITVKIK